MANNYNIIVIGAGQNGLVAAAYLAKQGKKVLVLERRGIVGGSVVTESFGDGFTVDPLWTGGTLRADIVRDLRLNLPAVRERPPFISLQPDSFLHFDPDPIKASGSIKRFSQKDAARWPEFVRFMDKSAKILDKAYATIMPRLPLSFNAREGFGLMDLGLRLRLAGRRDMLNFIRALPMTAQELVEEYFDSEAVKAAVASLGIHGVTLGPMGAGTGYTLIHNWLNRGGLAHPNVGRTGAITQALAGAVKSHGGEIRTNAEVACIQVDRQVAKGVILSSGEELSADLVLSSADPKHTLLELVGPRELPPEFVWHVQSIKMRGSLAKVHFLTDGRHGIPSGTVVLAPSIKYLERAYDAAKYGQISEHPYLEVTTSGNTVSIHFQFAPYHLKYGVQELDPGTPAASRRTPNDWNEKRQWIEKIAIDTLAEYFPNLHASTKNQKSLTPLDLEQTYGLTEGDLNHGQLMLDQFLFMRPIPGWSNHRTPVDHLYLCGSGVHGGGGVSGAAGRNVVNAIRMSSL